MTEEKCYKVEWKIENLSSWCEAVHGKSIKCPDQGLAFGKLELFPKGASGQDDRMEVCCPFSATYNLCKVSFDFDGSLIVVGPIQQGKGVNSVFLGAKFDDLVEKIREVDHKDHITLTLSFPHVFCLNRNRYMCTKLRVTNLPFMIEPKEVLNDNLELGTFIFCFSEKSAKEMRIIINRLGEKIHLIMKTIDNIESPILIESYLNILNGDGKIVKKETNKHVFRDCKEWLFSDSLKEEDLENEGVIIKLRLKVIKGNIEHKYYYTCYNKVIKVDPDSSRICFSDIKKSENPSSLHHCEDSVAALSKELMCLYQDQKFTDLELKCDNVAFPVHRNILCARSPVFDTMLSCDMRETASGKVDIEDLHPSTLARFLTFLYTGTVGERLEGESALNLYYAADKYQVPSLKKECSDFICSNVSISNVCDILSLADKHQDDRLSSVAQDFIVKNYNQVLSSKEWNGLVNSNPLLAAKTVTYFAQKMYVGKLDTA